VRGTRPIAVDATAGGSDLIRGVIRSIEHDFDPHRFDTN
jgi:hypothetical protein